MADTNTPQFVQVRLGDLLPNPYRKIDQYPLIPDKITNLRKSMKDTGFWKNVIVRPSPTQPGRYELAYGHHRVRAAIEELGEDYEHWFPLEHHDDYMMMLVLTHENSDDWSSPVEHWMLVVEVARDWLETTLDQNGEKIALEIRKSYSTVTRKYSADSSNISPEARVFSNIYSNENFALSALRTYRERGVEAHHIAQFLGDRFVVRSAVGDNIQTKAIMPIARAFELLPASPKRKAWLEAEARRKEEERLALEEQTRSAETERRERDRLEREARQRSYAEQQKRRAAEQRQREEEAKAQAALQAKEEARHDGERRIAEAERQMALSRARQAAEEQAERERLRQEAHEQADRERDAKKEQEERLKSLEEERDRQERTRLRDQAMFERLLKDEQVDPEAIRLCKTWVVAMAFRDKVLDPHVRKYLTRDRQKDLLLDIMAAKGERLTPDVLVREIDVRIGRVERVVADQAELGAKIERAADDAAAKVRAARRAFDTLRTLVEEARIGRNEAAMISAITAVSQANFAEVVRTIDDLKQDAEALAGIASPRPSRGRTQDASPTDRPDIALAAQ